jgi:hypothetical protein
MNLGIPPRDDCLGDQRQFEEERDSKFSWALARKIKWANLHPPRLRANCLIIRHYQLPISSHSQRDHIFHRRLSDRSLLYSWTTCLTDCGYRIRATSTNICTICTLLHVPVVLRFLAITRIGNLIREALSAFPQMLCMSKLRVPRRFRLVQQLRVHMNVFDGKGAALINKTLLQLPQ